MRARSHADLHNIRLGVERVKKVSDRIVGIGPIGIGLDGILGFVPVLGVAYTVIAGSMLMMAGVRARASPMTLRLPNTGTGAIFPCGAARGVRHDPLRGRFALIGRPLPLR